MIAKDGKVQTSPKGSISFPYGAAALTRQLAELSTRLDSDSSTHTLSKQSTRSSNGTATTTASPRAHLEEEMKAQFRQAYVDLGLPDTLKHKAKHSGLTLYLSGGGFRGWGYLLMSQHKVSPYPIPIINGFHALKREFQQTAAISAVAAEQCVFRISKRRAAQVPAVAFLVNVLVDALPMITQVRFCQGGVREGFLFDALDTATKALDPLSAATAQYGGGGSSGSSSMPTNIIGSASDVAALLGAGLPGENDLGRSLPATFTTALVRAVADLMYLHLPLPKESRSVAALHAPLTGVLASAHGISHADRALLALTLCARWTGDLPPPYAELQTRLRAILTHQEVFWANYLGALTALIGAVYPAGRIESGRPRLQFSARWADGLGKKGLNQGIVLQIKCRRRRSETGDQSRREDDAMTGPAALNPWVHDLEKLGKKKNRVGGEHGYGVPIEVEIERVLD